MATTRLLTLSESDRIISVLREGHEESLSRYKNCVFKKYKLHLIDGTERIIRKCDGKIIVSSAEAPDIIRIMHEDLMHADDKTTWFKLREKYGNISRLAVEDYIKKCQKCTRDKYGIYEALFKTIKPDLDNRGHVDVIGMPPDGMYHFILHYRLIKTGYCIIRPIRNDAYEEIAFALYCIFVDFGYPDVLQSNSRKFTSHIIREISKLSPQNLMISGKYKEEHQKYSQAVKESVFRWMNKSLTAKWTRGLPLVQWEENNATKGNFPTSFESLFSKRSSIAISSVGPPNLLGSVLYEEEVKPVLDLCNPDNLTTSELPKHGSSRVKLGNSKNDESIRILNEKSTIQTVECFKRKTQYSVADNAKKLKITATFSLASSDITMHNEGISAAKANSDSQKITSANQNLKAIDEPAWDISLETSVIEKSHNIPDIHIKTEPIDENNPLQTGMKSDVIPVIFQNNNISHIHRKIEPIDEKDPLKTDIKGDIIPVAFPIKAESSRFGELPLLKIKEEFIVPDM